MSSKRYAYVLGVRNVKAVYVARVNNLNLLSPWLPYMQFFLEKQGIYRVVIKYNDFIRTHKYENAAS